MRLVICKLLKNSLKVKKMYKGIRVGVKPSPLILGKSLGIINMKFRNNKCVQISGQIKQVCKGLNIVYLLDKKIDLKSSKRSI